MDRTTARQLIAAAFEIIGGHPYDKEASKLGAVEKGRYAGGRLLYKFKEQDEAEMFARHVQSTTPEFRVTVHPRAVRHDGLWYVNIFYN